MCGSFGKLIIAQALADITTAGWARKKRETECHKSTQMYTIFAPIWLLKRSDKTHPCLD